MSVALTRSETSPSLIFVTVGPIELAFSYETVIAFDAGEGWVMSENIWSTTTGKHINEVSRGPRIDRADFEQRLEDMLAFLNDHETGVLP